MTQLVHFKADVIALKSRQPLSLKRSVEGFRSISRRLRNTMCRWSFPQRSTVVQHNSSNVTASQFLTNLTPCEVHTRKILPRNPLIYFSSVTVHLLDCWWCFSLHPTHNIRMYSLYSYERKNYRSDCG